MSIIFKTLVFVVLILFAVCILILSVKEILDIIKLRKDKNKSCYKRKVLEHIIELQLQTLILCIIILCICLILKGEFLMDIWIDILINVGCSIVTSIVLSVIIYFKFLKRIPDETREKIDELLNSRLGYETTNHNAVMQKSDTVIQKADKVQESLSREHSEIRQYVYSTNKSISDLSGKIDKEKALKKIQYDYLKENEKAIVESINHISNLGERLKEINHENKILKYENHNLKIENKKLMQQNSELNAQLKKHQSQINNFTQHM